MALYIQEYEAENNLKKYYALKENLNAIISRINISIDNLQQALKNCLNAYNAEETSEGYKELSKNLQTLVNKRDNIKNKIIPEINLKISKLKKQIEDQEKLM